MLDSFCQSAMAVKLSVKSNISVFQSSIAFLSFMYILTVMQKDFSFLSLQHSKVERPP